MHVIFKICIFIALLSFLLTHIIRLVAVRHNIIDIPNQRSSHKIPTPRGGGIAILISWFVGISVLLYLNRIELNLFLALMSGILLAVVSFIDDILTLPPGIRLVTQFISTAIAFYFMGGINPIAIGNVQISSGIILYPLAIIGIVWFINLFNFLDGIDGYASLEAIFVSFFLFLISGQLFCLILISAVLGFLYWNWPQAKIFMGDIGSTQLGFVLAIFGVYFHNSSDFTIIHWIILTSLFWFDATFTLLRRIKNQEKLTQPHKKHAYQRIVQCGYSHQKTIIFSIFLNLIICGLALLSYYHVASLFFALFLNILFLYFVIHIIDKKSSL